MKKVLFIPHHPDFKKLKIRLAELANVMSKDYEVYLLDWHSASSRYDWPGRAGACLKDLCKLPKLSKRDSCNVLEIPMLHRPLCCAPFFNAFWLVKMIESLKIDVVINGSYYLFSIPKRRKFRYIVDLADFLGPGEEGSFQPFTEKQVRKEVAKADAITTSSQGLVELVHERYRRQACFLPNGASLDKFNNVSQREVEDLLAEYGLKGKWVIGHIGLLGEWVDLEFLLKVFNEIKQLIPHAALLIVGGSSRLAEYKKRFMGTDVVFTGPIDSSRIASYFCACDVGVLPNKKSEFQDLAFHIKLIEYSAAKKFVVSSDLDEIKKMNFPNIIVFPLRQDMWIEALLKVKGSSWNRDWDVLVEGYDWEKIAMKMKEIIESI